MKKYDEIKDIIVNKLGYHNLAAYQAIAYNAPQRTTPLSKETLEILSPNNVDNRDFWRVSNELFGHDPVCNQQMATNSLLVSNRQNLQLARFAGALSFVEGALIQYPPARVLEVGVGFGNFKHWLEANHFHSQYIGVDVAPQIPEITVTTEAGTIPPELVIPNSIDLAYSSNVFQHLSVEQRNQYYRDIFTMLKPGCVFVFNMLSQDSSPKPTKGYFDEEGNAYLGHYGQYTKVQTFNEAGKELNNVGFRMSMTSYSYFSHLSNFCVFKPQPEQEPAAQT